MKRVLYGLRFGRDHRWLQSRASEYLDRELDPRARRRVELHTAGCPECRELLRSLLTLIEALGTIRDAEDRVIAGAVLASVHSRLGELPRDRP